MSSITESERDDYSDEGNSPKSSLSQKFTKSSYYLELGNCTYNSSNRRYIFSIANFVFVLLDPDLDPNQRIEVLEQKLQELRKAYLALKQELSSIDKRRKKLRRREREGKYHKLQLYVMMCDDITCNYEIPGRMMTRNEANSLL